MSAMTDHAWSPYGLTFPTTSLYHVWQPLLWNGVRLLVSGRIRIFLSLYPVSLTAEVLAVHRHDASTWCIDNRVQRNEAFGR
jgi:hypothetical protein